MKKGGRGEPNDKAACLRPYVRGREEKRCRIGNCSNPYSFVLLLYVYGTYVHSTTYVCGLTMHASLYFDKSQTNLWQQNLKK